MKIKRSSRLWLLSIFGMACLNIAIFGILIWSQNWFGDVSAASTSDLNGKAVLFDGDSIAMGSYAEGDTSAPRWSYANYIEETYNINKTNVSIGGARLYWPNAASDTNCSSGDAQKCVIPNHLTSAIKNTTYDYIILEGGINDLHSNYYNGDHTSYATALRNYFETVTTNPKWAHAKIGFVIVPRPDYSRRTTYRPEEEKVFWKTIQNICDEYSIEYINFFKQESSDSYTVPSGFNWNSMTTVASSANDNGSFDGIHPSKGAHKIIGEYIAKWMIDLPNYKYTVNFNSNGSSLSGAANQSVVHGKKATTPGNPVRDGYNFMYWSESDSCESAFDFNTAISGDKTLYACWSKTSIGTPDTGGNIKQDENNTNVVMYVLPVTIIVLTGVLYIKHRNKAHRKFE